MTREHVTEEMKERSKLSKDEWREFTQTVWPIPNEKDKDHPAVFPDEIPHRLIKMFSFVEETVLDPFAGTGTTMEVARRLERNSIGCEVNPDYINRIETELDQATFGEFDEEKVDTSHEIYEQDARDLSFLDDESIDLIVTSPPYWNMVDYGNGEEDEPIDPLDNDDMPNLGTIDDYDAFIDEMEKVIRECQRVLKPGRRLCIITSNVHNHTDHGLQRYPIASDYIVRAREMGFLLVGEVIWSKHGTGGGWGSKGGNKPIFGSYPYPQNFLFKDVHEYIIILRKKPE